MPKSTISTLLVIFGEIRGWKGAFHAYQFRYRSSKVINESGKFFFRYYEFDFPYQVSG